MVLISEEAVGIVEDVAHTCRIFEERELAYNTCLKIGAKVAESMADRGLLSRTVANDIAKGLSGKKMVTTKHEDKVIRYDFIRIDVKGWRGDVWI